MGQRGVYATIQKNPETGEYVLEHVTVQWALHLHHVLNYLLQDPERTQADKCLNVLKTLSATVNISARLNISKTTISTLSSRFRALVVSTWFILSTRKNASV